jgi:hypothetical protein
MSGGVIFRSILDCFVGLKPLIAMTMPFEANQVSAWKEAPVSAGERQKLGIHSNDWM